MQPLKPRWLTTLLVKVPGLALVANYFIMPDELTGLFTALLAVVAFLVIALVLLRQDEIVGWEPTEARRHLTWRFATFLLVLIALFSIHGKVVGRHTYSPSGPPVTAAETPEEQQSYPILVPAKIVLSAPYLLYPYIDCRDHVIPSECDRTRRGQVESVEQVTQLISVHGIDGIIVRETWLWQGWAVVLMLLFASLVWVLVSIYATVLIRGVDPEGFLRQTPPTDAPQPAAEPVRNG